MSLAVPILAVVAFMVLALVALPIFFYQVHVGSSGARQGRQQEILRSLDGRPEVKVLATGTGWSMEQTVWVAQQHGYQLSHMEGVRAQPRYLVLRSTQAFTPFPPPPPQGTFPPPPGSPELRPAHQEMRKAGNPGAVYGLAFILGLPGCGMVVKAVTAARHGESFAGQALLGVAMLAGAIALIVVARRMTRRNAPGSMR
ncbi:hypothetical protein [Streptomyces fractus]|uniref:hypothetical protein n=1 Tax=Streptomyces fractus TaxID=641806 RepID=UPI003CE726ED